MSAYGDEAIDHLVKIDNNHAEFVRALVMCQKPRRVLELGFGSGEATRAILAGLRYNRQNFEYTIVDNWLDFGGIKPDITRNNEYNGVNFIYNNEKEFILSCKYDYEFIFSDADHYQSHLWMDIVYNNILSRGGVLIYHDVNNVAGFPNLLQIYQDIISKSYHYILLNRNSVPGERCDRGLLAIFKH